MTKMSCGCGALVMHSGWDLLFWNIENCRCRGL